MNAIDLYQYFDGDVRALLDCARRSKQSLIVAHRGGFAPGFPENSIEAIERTIAAGPFILEIDVMATSDGVNFLHHDKDLNRTTNGVGDVSQANWARVSSLNLIDNGYMRTNSKPVTFEAALDLNQNKFFWMLDLKAPRSTAELTNSIAAAGMLSATIFIVYNHEQARTVLRAQPEALIALGASDGDKIKQNDAAGFSDTPYVALTGRLDENADFLPAVRDSHNYILAGTYYHDNPPDAQLGTNERVHAFDVAGRAGYQLIVSNRPLLAQHYLEGQGLGFDPAQCSGER